METGANGHFERRLVSLSVLAAAITLVLGAAVLFGWAFQLESLQSVPPGLALFATANIGIFALLIWRLARSMRHTEAGRRAAEVSLRASEGRLRTMIDSSLSAVILIDSGGRITEWNARAEAMFGRSRHEAIGRELAETVIPVRYRDAHRKGLRRYLETGEGPVMGRPLAMTALAADNREFPVELSISAFTEGDSVSFCGFVTDVSERIRAEEAVRRMNTELENRVLERTAELEIANRELEAFSYSVSHDLRAPLRAIAGFSQIAVSEHAEQLPERVLRYLNSICDNTRRMERLIEDLLAFSRSGRQSLAMLPLQFGSLVRNVLAELERELELAGRHTEVRVAELHDCVGDPSLLKQVVMNLVSNAVKFTRARDKALIEITSREDGAEIIYCVRDNGAGFDMRYAAKLFGVFERLHSGTEFEGTGIGLSIAKRIVQRHGGRIWAEGRVDEGAAFYFTVPKLRVDAIGSRQAIG